MMSINFEFNQIKYNNNLNLIDFNQLKFGFEYLTPNNIPIRAGLIYKQPSISILKPTSIFTFGTGKTIQNINIDLSGNYSIYTYNYPDLFVIPGEVRPEYDLIRESEFIIKFDINYVF